MRARALIGTPTACFDRSQEREDGVCERCSALRASALRSRTRMQLPRGRGRGEQALAREDRRRTRWGVQFLCEVAEKWALVWTGSATMLMSRGGWDARDVADIVRAANEHRRTCPPACSSVGLNFLHGQRVLDRSFPL